ncbi:hypothetical protein FS837_004016 [Tulasnella sp. UAMH 9824]|nr:hypothetical protein FS837_004016 [Tulasnella sp. UAMH 9824]
MENRASLATTVLAHRNHNERQPINQLPPELLYVIIENAYTQVSYKLLFALRSVCKHWMDIIDSMPQLWGQIALHQNANLLSAVLHKSPTQPLDVWCREGEGYRLADGPTFEERVAVFLEHVGPSAGRWGSLHYSAPTNAEHERMLGLSFRNLKTLYVNISGTAVDYTAAFDAPKLRNFDLWGLSLNWCSLSNLRSLQICGCVPSPTVDEVYVLLKSSPDLELFKISLNKASPTGHPTDLSGANSIPILLPRLRSLSLIQVPFVSHPRLLDLVEAPNLRRFRVLQQFHYESYDFTPMLESAGRFLGIFRHPCNEDDPSRLTVSGNTNNISITVGDRWVFLRNLVWTQGTRQQERPASLTTVLRQFDARLCDSIRVLRFFGIRDDQELLDLAQF